MWTRRIAVRWGLAGLAGLLVASPAQATAGLHAALERLLPPGLDPKSIGAAMRTQHPEASALSGVSRTGWDWVPARVAEDFAAGRVVSVDGWQLSETEARLCAALPAA